jgi:hypothetical protein
VKEIADDVSSNMKQFLFLLSSVVLGVSIGCEERTAREPGEEPAREAAGETPETREAEHMKTFETIGVREAIDEYRQNPTAENRLEVDKAFEKLDKEIAELENSVATTSGDEKAEAQRKLDDLRSFKNEQRVRYTGEQAETALEKTGETLEKAAERTGETVEKAAEKTGETLKRAGEEVKDAVTGEERR